MEEKQPTGILNGQTLLLLLAIAANAFWFHGIPLRSSRPKDQNLASEAVSALQDAEARLWQDPFEAVTSHLKESTKKGQLEDVERLIARVRKYLREKKSVCVMPVFTTGSPYGDGKEWRLKTRYAVLSALATANYVADDDAHVGHFQLAWPDVNDMEAQRSNLKELFSKALKPEGIQTITVPFEIFDWHSLTYSHPDSSTNAFDRVVVLWLRDEDFIDAPIKRLMCLLKGIDALGTATNGVNVKVLGPYSTTALRSMYHEAVELAALKFQCLPEISSPPKPETVVSVHFSKKNSGTNALISAAEGERQTKVPLEQVLGNIEMFSCTATAADKYVINDEYFDRDFTYYERRAQITRALSSIGIKFSNCILTDDELAGEMVRELELRGFNQTDKKPIIALISEWDTFYGRALPKSFEQSILKHNPNTAIIRMSYLRGIEGELSLKENNDAKGKGGASAESKAGRKEEISRAEGNSQLDYIPRMVDRLKETVGTMSSNDKGQLLAVGILGSDVYDKLLLLQSLRPYFPGTLFFTTDLDARLWHPKELKASRNLLVASSYGLALNREQQQDIAPFRDSYQTAQYAGCLSALGVIRKGDLNQLIPSIFEIGQSGAKDISISTPVAGQFFKEPGNIKPKLHHEIIWTSILCLLAAILLYRHSRSFRATTDNVIEAFNGNQNSQLNIPDLNWFAILCLVLAVFGFWLTYAIWNNHFDPAGKRFYLAEGISLWPTEILRYLGIVCGVVFIIQARLKLLANKATFHKDFFLPSPDLNQNVTRDAADSRRCIFGVWSKMKALWRLRSESSINRWQPALVAKGDEPPEIDAEKLWQEYNRLGTFKCRRLRALVDVAVYILLGWALVKLFNKPFVPYRGSVSHVLDQILLWGFVGIQLFITFYVVDAVKLCQKLIENLTVHPTKWPEATFRKFEKLYSTERQWLDEIIDMQVIGERSEAVNQLIMYPFLLICLGIIARASIFDRWDWPPSLIVIYALSGGYATYSVFVLRQSAESARELSLSRLRSKLIKVIGDGHGRRSLIINPFASESVTGIGHDGAFAAQIKELQSEIKTYAKGAFAPISQHPIVRALIMPFGGAGLLAILEFLSTH
jgi:hypothetical protein